MNPALRAIALLASCVALLPAMVAAASPPPNAGTYTVPQDLGNLCVTDTMRLEQTLASQWRPEPAALDQWTSLLRTLTCDLTGKQDLGWRRVPLRSYATAVSYPLTWVEYQIRGGKERRIVHTYRSRSQMPQKLEFWVGGHIDEVHYDARHRTLAARFPAARSSTPGSSTLCSATRLRFRLQQGAWFLSGVEPLRNITCRVG